MDFRVGGFEESWRIGCAQRTRTATRSRGGSTRSVSAVWQVASVNEIIPWSGGSSEWPAFVAGHSLGGKVALEYLRCVQGEQEADRKLPKQVWILDAQLGPVSSDLAANHEVDKIIQTVQASNTCHIIIRFRTQSLPLPIPSRKWLYSKIRSELGMSLEVAHWLGSNLVGHPQGPMRWLFNVHGASEMYESYKSVPSAFLNTISNFRSRSCWEVVMNPPQGTMIHIVRGDKSERWNPILINELHGLHSRVNNQQLTQFTHNAYRSEQGYMFWRMQATGSMQTIRRGSYNSSFLV